MPSVIKVTVVTKYNTTFKTWEGFLYPSGTLVLWNKTDDNTKEGNFVCYYLP